MHILAPFSKAGEVPLLIDAGASELYCGVVDKRWQKLYSYVSSINLRHDRAANLSSFNELKDSIQTAHSMDAKVFLALNAHFYSQQQLPIVLKQAEKAAKAGIDTLIVADSALIPKLKSEFDVNISLSTGNPVFNNSALDFFGELGIDRVVFPRHLTVKEIEGLSKHAKKLGLSTECFVLNAICPNIDGLCTFQHMVDESISFAPVSEVACRQCYKVTALKAENAGKKLAAESHARIWNNTHYSDCGLCALPYFKGFGINSVKIAGRGNSTEKKLADVRVLREAIEFLEKNKLAAKQFKEKCREFYFELFHSKCDYIHCYYASTGLE